MNRVKYRQLVESLEQTYDGRADALRASASRMMLCSYAYIVLVLAVSIILVAASVWMMVALPGGLTIKLGIFLMIGFGSLGYSILRGVFVKMSPPEGLTLTKENAPELFVMLDEIIKKEKVTNIHKVILTGEFNAAAVQFPKLGMLGWCQNYLIIGLPLMQHLSAGEFKSVVAHEFGHLSNRDGSSGNWIYRMRVTWEQIITRMANGGAGGGFAIRPFVSWFWPRFNARAFVLSRQQEYLADAMAAEYTSVDIAGDALKRVYSAGSVYEDEVYNEVLRRVNTEADAPENFYAISRAEMLESNYIEKQYEYQNQALLLATDQSNTHPSLTDRLNALGVKDHASLPSPVIESASGFYLKQREDEFEKMLAKEWHTAMQAAWKERHVEVQKSMQRMEELSNPQNKEEYFDRARIAVEVLGAEKGIAYYRELLDMYPDSIEAKYMLGSHLTQNKDQGGVALLYEVLMKEPNASEEVFGELYNYYSNVGDTKKLLQLEEEADQFDERMAAAVSERDDTKNVKNLSPPELSDKDMQSVKAAVAKHKYVKEVYVAKRELKYFPDFPSHLFALKVKFPALKYTSEDAKEKILEQLIQDISIEEGDYYLLVDEKNHKSICKNIRQKGVLVCSVTDGDTE